MATSSQLVISKKLIRQASETELPTEIVDTHGYIREANEHIGVFFKRIRALPRRLNWSYCTPSAFERRAAELDEIRTMGVFYADQLHQMQIFTVLQCWKTESILRSLIRSLNASELVAPALLARGLMEHAVSGLDHVREPLDVFNAVAESNVPISVPHEQRKRIEEKLLKAIWGTRINTSKLLDKSDLWDQNPYESGESIAASNVIGSFQKLARGVPDMGKVAYKVYEWLCDVVHPNTQGLRVFWDSIIETEPGQHSVALSAEGHADQGVSNAITLWGVGFAAVMTTNTIDAVNRSVEGVQVRLGSVYRV